MKFFLPPFFLCPYSPWSWEQLPLCLWAYFEPLSISISDIKIIYINIQNNEKIRPLGIRSTTITKLSKLTLKYDSMYYARILYKYRTEENPNKFK